MNKKRYEISVFIDYFYDIFIYRSWKYRVKKYYIKNFTIIYCLYVDVCRYFNQLYFSHRLYIYKYPLKL